ncbi:MAG TPA: hypothetical protein GYA06_07010 [Chloroflexi bacterium]|nr:hypothetical protein [Chloroflexota bacterium]
MERTVPRTASYEIDLYLRTMYSLLRSSTEVKIRSLEEVHAATNSSLHPDARSTSPDLSAFIYALLRLPECIFQVRSVALGQTPAVFARHGYPDVEQWQPVSARARRRRCLYDGKQTLACFIASRSDIDDVIPTLTAFQIEWNKLHLLLESGASSLLVPEVETDPRAFAALADALEMSEADLLRLKAIWGGQFLDRLQEIARRELRLGVRLLEGSLSEYWRATRAWWDNIESCCGQVIDRPVYFVSSNTHSLANLFSGYALRQRERLIEYVEREEEELKREWQAIVSRKEPASEENFLYYVLKKYQQSSHGRGDFARQVEAERERGITRIPSVHSFDLEAQVIELNRLRPEDMDPRLKGDDLSFLARSDAVIINIDYPLGLAAYNLLFKVAEHVGSLLGVYVMGKAATLNAVRGDVMIPTVVHDEHSQNTYLFRNAFTAEDVSPYLIYGTVLDNQKSVSVLGTFLQNANLMDVFYTEGFTVLEMEGGPYLSAVYEMYRPKRHPYNELVNLYGVPFDVGLLHYASDTPLTKGENLGAGTLSYYGMDSTYATSVAIARRIFARERERLGA